VPAFHQLPLVKFDEFYRKVISVFCKYNDIVYNEKTRSVACYLIYQGTCKLQKNFLNNFKKDASILDMKLVTVMNLEKGDLAGLEGIDGADSYEYTLVVFILLNLFRLRLRQFYLRWILIF